MERRKKRNRKSSNKLVGFVIVLVAVALVLFFNAKSNQINADNIAEEKEISELKQELEKESIRAQELEEYSKYVNTKQFIEDVAHKKLGLVYPGEKIFTSVDE